MKPSQYINRELSWLDFNYRCLEEAYDKTNPIMNRLMFLSITASNLDEFVMVRMAGIMDQIGVGYEKRGLDGRTPKELLKEVNAGVHEMMKHQYNCYNKSLLPELESAGIRFVKDKDMTDVEQVFASDYFDEFCYPVLTPQAVDSSRPFPLVKNQSVYLCVILSDTETKKKKKKSKDKDKDKSESLMAIVEIPGVLSRILALPGTVAGGEMRYAFIEDIITPRIGKLFPGYIVRDTALFRVTRNGDLAIDEDEAEDLLIEIEKSIQQRKWGACIRLEVSRKMEKSMLARLTNELDVTESNVYECKGPLDLTCLSKFQGRPEFSDKRAPKWQPLPSPDFYGQDNIFDIIREKDRLLHHPYQSFDTVIDFISKAARDPKVLAIKQTLYRVSGDSPIIDELIHAADNGKQVTVLVELKARFDEANNIVWAKKLEKAGCHVIYGLPGLKIHCKMILVVREEDDGIRRYVHLGTGNYNDVTAGLYTDIGMLTAKDSYASDASTLFNLLSGYSHYTRWNKFAVAPKTLRSFFVRMIKREIKNAEMGGKGLIIAKMNALIDDGIIDLLYEASNAGVEIRLIVRGMCSLIPGVPELSENIAVHSIVGTFLEHSRIYYFYNNGDDEIYMSSADWMQRNLNRRIETLFPVDDPDLRSRLFHILDITWNDTIKTRIMTADKTYVRVDKRGKPLLECQKHFCEESQALYTEAKKQALIKE